MSGFEFSHRLSGGVPTIRRIPIKGLQILTAGDMLNLEDGEADLAIAGDTGVIGVALETEAGSDAPSYVDVIIDADAVYSAQDPDTRRRGDGIDVSGATGAQLIAGRDGGPFLVVADSDAGMPTLIRIQQDKHGTAAVGAWDTDAAARLNAALARAMTSVLRKYLGRGPSRAEAFFRKNVVVLVLEDSMTYAERSLASGGGEETVHAVRSAMQHAMREDLVRAVEELTSTKVRAFLSDSHLDPDVAAEVFVLDRPVHPGRASAP